MRKALRAIQSLLLIYLFVDCSSFAIEDKKSGSLKYNYVVESELSLTDFSDAFFERLKTKHNWNEVFRNNCEDEACTSLWNFTDDELHKWKCEVVIKKADGISNKMMVSMEMNPIMGS